MARTIQETRASDSIGEAARTRKPVLYMETIEAYNRWAELTLDTIEMQQLLPQLLDKVAANPQTDAVKLVDLGCGTGRNTRQLLRLASEDAHIIGLDTSPGMLDVARMAIDNEKESHASLSNAVSLEIYDLLQSPPAPPFFEGLAALMRPGGYFLLTNMHSEMGSISQVGFVDAATETKIRPTSYPHTIADVLKAAEKVGFVVEELNGERVRERKVDETMVGELGKRAQKWIGITVWFAICFRKRLW
ncbi:S-adenosyl-L-methionine-dependent methyltransferase [Aspergillus coremiiformis]|uniref:S-adenosyl-L-methionine-dependent methyltransferase n=1 Tax=Aspergillus coremiiformis TaxID=138285 RepID=A0A5N6Z9M2_9EURO|nr:S-adenosyl-L-methionine-dependent methyltransferase [Aspergillus coremiiformis]